MLENKRVITLLFLFSFSLLLAHGIIPHRHPGDTCLSDPISHHTAHHAGESGTIPWHCHPFNQVVLIKQHFAWKISDVRPGHTFQVIVAVGNIRIPIIPAVSVITVSITAIHHLSYTLYTPDRAPPVLS